MDLGNRQSPTRSTAPRWWLPVGLLCLSGSLCLNLFVTRAGHFKDAVNQLHFVQGLLLGTGFGLLAMNLLKQRKRQA